MSNPPLPDRDEILRAVRLIAAPGQVVELRALNVLTGDRGRPVTYSGYFDDFERLADAAARLRGAQGIYITLNPPDPAVLARCANRLRVAAAGSATSDADIIARRWLPVDADPVRPAEISASDAEHDAALEIVRRIRDFLAGLGWPAPILADSGNGGHLLYRIDLPVEDLTGLRRPVRSDSPNPLLPAHGAGLVERVLAALAARFDDAQVRVDAKVFNPARIWKLYGTVARKGDHTPDRPHRLARILEAPDELVPVPRELLETLAESGGQRPVTRDLRSVIRDLKPVIGDLGSGTGERRSGGRGPFPVTNTQSPVPSPQFPAPFSLDAWLAAHEVPAQGPQSWQGGRRWVFSACPWNPEHRNSAYIVELPSGAIAAGCHHNSCAGRGWRELKQLYDCGPAEPVRDSLSIVPDPGPVRDGTDLNTAVPQTSPGPDVQSEINSWPIVGSRAERAEVEARALELAPRCVWLDRADLMEAAAALRRRGLSGAFTQRWLAAVRDLRRRARAAANEPPPPEYEAEEGRIYRLAWEMAPDGRLHARRTVVADFALRIVEEAEAEDGRVWFGLAGEAADGRALGLELAAADFADDRMLQAAVTAVAGPRCPVRAHMLRHLRPAIQLLSTGEIPRTLRFDRTGWVELEIAESRLRIEDASPPDEAVPPPDSAAAAASGGSAAPPAPAGSAAPPAPAGSETRRELEAVASGGSETRRVQDDISGSGVPGPDGEAGPGSDEAASAATDAGDNPPRPGLVRGPGQSTMPGTAGQGLPNSQSTMPGTAGQALRNPQLFLLPGREPPGVSVRLPRKLPYRVEPGGDLAQGLVALEAVLNAGDLRRTTVLLAALLGAPLARPAGLQGERYGVFLSGRTGSLKTSTAQALMCIYGAGFIEDEHLLKMGEGATRNALMRIAAHVYDLPLLLDNYKPGTGEGARGFVNLLHNLLEGGDRERMTRSAELRESRPLHCWPIFTGEDVPDADTAGLARLLILPFEPPQTQAQTLRVSQTPRVFQAPPGDRLTALGQAQAMAADLPAVGEAWLAWLEGEGAAVAGEAGARFPLAREEWLARLRARYADMANPLRVASSLACNELAWWALRRHPDLGALAERLQEAHAAGVALAAEEAGSRTAVSLEAVRFLAVLRELLVTGRCELIPKGGDRTPVEKDAGSGGSLPRGSAAGDRYPSRTGSPADGRPGGGRMAPQGESAGPLPERTLGWERPDGSIYLLPELARREVERVLGPGGLNGISSRTLHEQLFELGLIAGRDPGRYTRKIREGGRTHNVLHLRPDALEG